MTSAKTVFGECRLAVGCVGIACVLVLACALGLVFSPGMLIPVVLF